ADTDNNRVRKVLTDGTISTVAGTGTAGLSGDEGPGTLAELDHPADIMLGADGALYIADEGNERIRRVTSDDTISTVVGGGAPPDGLGDGGPPTDAAVFPEDLSVDQQGRVFVADGFNNRIRKATLPSVPPPNRIVHYSYTANGELQTKMQLSPAQMTN
ncbi:MAG TPA: hypothetical protein VIY86_06825, partial [Pirellulaceae bacterium]